ncbi:MAG: zinc ribbon domain-containing protein [Candidatus Lokiarchaeota archaeon]|nr:zinc ribbon domain-containing protein [Candidatus Lokiarchaeota archaeon]
MDVAKFNQELSYKVAKANGLEKHNRFQDAIDLWLEISEMALNASKAPNIEIYYKSMIIEKTKQIINHIKDLKSKLYGQKRKDQISRQEAIPLPKSSEAKTKEEIIEDEIEFTHSETPESSTFSNDIETSGDVNEAKIIENSEIKNLPIGFKEIEVSEDFKIITPHDKDYVKKMLSQDHDMSVFTHDDKEVKGQSQTEPDIPLEKTKIICFACGSDIPVNSEVCPTCGTSLK